MTEDDETPQPEEPNSEIQGARILPFRHQESEGYIEVGWDVVIRLLFGALGSALSQIATNLAPRPANLAAYRRPRPRRSKTKPRRRTRSRLERRRRRQAAGTYKPRRKR